MRKLILFLFVLGNFLVMSSGHSANLRKRQPLDSEQCSQGQTGEFGQIDKLTDDLSYVRLSQGQQEEKAWSKDIQKRFKTLQGSMELNEANCPTQSLDRQYKYKYEVIQQYENKNRGFDVNVRHGQAKDSDHRAAITNGNLVKLDRALQIAGQWAKTGSPGHKEIASHMQQEFVSLLYNKENLEVFFLCNKKKEIVSFGIINHKLESTKPAYVEYIMSRPTANNVKEGGGRAVVSHALMKSVSNGKDGICLSSGKDAVGFYEHLKFRHVAQPNGYIHHCLNVKDSREKFPAISSEVVSSFDQLKNNPQSLLLPDQYDEVWKKRFGTDSQGL